MSSASPPNRSSRFTLWTHRELLWQFTLRNVELRHKGSHLGLLWSFLNPLLMLALYVFVFGYIFQGKLSSAPTETKVEYALGIFLGLSVFQIFSEVLSTAPNVITLNPNFVKKAVFPLEVLPVASVAASVFHMLITLAMVLLGVAFLGPGIGPEVFWLPVILIPFVFFVLGVAWYISALGVFLRDINQLVAFLSMVLMYASAIFYSTESIPSGAWTYMRFNPLLLTIDLARDAILWKHPINPLHLTYVTGVGLVACFSGFYFFRKVAPAFADVL